MFNGSSSTPSYNSFSINTPQYGSKEFLQSNTIVGKFAFLILVLFVFLILLRLGISLLSWLISNSTSPHFIDGMVDAKQMLIFKQDPNSKHSKTLARSINQNDGIEFTWSVWLYIDDITTNQGNYRHIFHKGNSDMGPNGLVHPNNAPGMYIMPNTNGLYIVMNTYTNINESITILDIPIHKWINVIIRCENTNLDVYINGVITQSIQLKGVPKQNYGDVYTSMNGGFSGYISNLWYYDKALGVADINSIARRGPNLKMVGGNGIALKNADYLALRWYFDGANNQVDTGLTSV